MILCCPLCRAQLRRSAFASHVRSSVPLFYLRRLVVVAGVAVVNTHFTKTDVPLKLRDQHSIEKSSR